MAQTQAQAPNALVAIGPIIIFAVMIFFLFRSQHKEGKRRQKMIDDIRTGDRIVTTGGIIGVVANVKEKTIVVKIADNVKVEIVKSGVGTVLEKEEAAQTKDSGKGDAKNPGKYNKG